MRETCALDEILRAAYSANGTAAMDYQDVIQDVPVIMNGTCVVTMGDGTRVRLTARVVRHA